MDSMNGTNTKTMSFRDPVVENVCDKFLRRSDVGYEKYGRTLHTERIGKHKDLLGYLNDIQEELMDAILYIQTAREEMFDQMEELRMNNIMRNGNDGEHYGEKKES